METTGKPVSVLAVCCLLSSMAMGQTVYVSRMWHNHQPLYWPEWNGNGAQTQRVEYAWDSISLKGARSYAGSAGQHPENDLGSIFGIDDRRSAYQSRPRDSLSGIPEAAGFCLSYSGSLIDNIRQLGEGGHLGYGEGWWDGNRTAKGWATPSGSSRLDLVGFTYHHSLAPLLPKEVLRKEIRIHKQAWWKAWGGNPDLSDHSKGFFPTEMAFSPGIVDVLVEEGYEWSIVASHHLSRTCPTYLDRFDLANGSYGVFSSPPNRADLLGPSPVDGWWYGQPNPGNAAWNVSPFAYQLHRVRHVDPESGEVRSILVVPSDDVLSYAYGYGNEGISRIQEKIAPFASDSSRPVIVLPATDGDNAWGGGFSSWMEATPQYFNDSKNAGFQPTAVQDFVNAHGAAAGTVHIEDGAWIFPESDYGSPYFLKWIEPPVAATAATRHPGTVVDMETPGFALKFWAWAPVITGANWCETAEQILKDEGGSVQDWKVQAPYDWDGTSSSSNEVELAWHIYLGGLDSGFNYYGGLGNDDEVKAALATTRAIEKLQPWMSPERRANDRTPPSVLKPQRFPHNPGGYTFGWFNSIPGGDTNYLKKMPSEFYVWTHAYDLSGVEEVSLRVRIDVDGVNTLSNDQNEIYAGGPDVGNWVTIPMTRRALPNSQIELNAAANNGQINYFITPPELADYYFSKISDDNLPDFRGKLIDYYIEASDGLGNVHRSEIQHVFVEDDGETGGGGDLPGTPSGLVVASVTTDSVSLDWNDVSEAASYVVYRDGVETGIGPDSDWLDIGRNAGTTYRYSVAARNAAGTSAISAEVSATTLSGGGGSATPFVMDGIADSQGYLLANPGMTLFAAVRGSKLYVATWAPGASGNDHFVMIASSVLSEAASPSPWAKAGMTSLPSFAPFLGAESENSYAGWFNANGAGTEIARGGEAQHLEGVIDLAAFGSPPSDLFLCALAYQTGDGGMLVSQAPDSSGGAGNVDADELIRMPLEVLRDEDANGLFDRLEPGKGFVITDLRREVDSLKLTWQAFPGRSYQVETLGEIGGEWIGIPGLEIVAGEADGVLETLVPGGFEEARGFYRVKLVE
ncbi:hypothetical protein [Haloferula sp.]|uniref:hypothetical protein n=1 Tax=Haloferula sp. TaxID=2497595 RepID=UPI003C75835F